MQKFHESGSSNFHSRSQSFDSFCQRQGSIPVADQKDRSPGNLNIKFRVGEALISWRNSLQNWTLTLPVVLPCSQGLSSFQKESWERTLQFMRAHSEKAFFPLVTRDLNVDYLSFPTFSLRAVLPLCLLISDAYVAFEDLQSLTLGFTLIVGKEPTVRSA